MHAPYLSTFLYELTLPFLLELAGILSTIFFHRIFPPVKPTTRDLLDLTLVCQLSQLAYLSEIDNLILQRIQPYVDDPELLAQIEEKTTSLIRSLENTGSGTSSGQIAGMTSAL